MDRYTVVRADVLPIPLLSAWFPRATASGSIASLGAPRPYTAIATISAPRSTRKESDLHRECRHVIHHDLSWNPATLEQRTGRFHHLGSKTERLRSNGNRDYFLDVAVSYIAGTYVEHWFRIVLSHAYFFEVTKGGDYTIDGLGNVADAREPAAGRGRSGILSTSATQGTNRVCRTRCLRKYWGG